MLIKKTLRGFEREKAMISSKLATLGYYLPKLLKRYYTIEDFKNFLNRSELAFNILERNNKVIKTGNQVKFDMYVPAYPSRAYFTLTDTLMRTTPVPNNVLLSITSACRFSCDYCYQKKDRGKDVDIDILIKTVKKIQDMGVPFIHIQGGDPFLVFDRLEKVCRAIDERSEIWINATGDGITLERLKILKECNVKTIMFSLHYAEPEQLNTFMGNKDAFKVLEKGIELCHKADLGVAFNATLSMERIHNNELEPILERAKNFGATFFQLITPKSAGGSLDKPPEKVSRAEMEKLEELITKYNKEEQYADYPGIWAVSVKENKKQYGCYAGGIERFYINAKGDVQACEFLNLSFGNITEENFLNIYKRMRDVFPEARSCWLCREYAPVIDELVKKEHIDSLPLDKKQSAKIYNNWDRGEKIAYYTRLNSSRGPQYDKMQDSAAQIIKIKKRHERKDTPGKKGEPVHKSSPWRLFKKHVLPAIPGRNYMKKENTLVFTIKERGQGFMDGQAPTCDEGYNQGKKRYYEIMLDAIIEINDMSGFADMTGEHSALISGTVGVPGLGSDLPITGGSFRAFCLEETIHNPIVKKIISYEFDFLSAPGITYHFYGEKELITGSQKREMTSQLTSLRCTVYEGKSRNEKKVYARGMVKTLGFLSMMKSIAFKGYGTPAGKLRMVTTFVNFVYAELLPVYFNSGSPFFQGDWKMLTLNGTCTHQGKEKEYLLFNGVNTKGVDWGRPQNFTDICLILSHTENGEEQYEKYIISKPSLGKHFSFILKDSISHPDEKNPLSTFSYKGKMLHLKEGTYFSYTDDLNGPDPDETMVEIDSEIHLEFQAEIPRKNGLPKAYINTPIDINDKEGNKLLNGLLNNFYSYFPVVYGMFFNFGFRMIHLQKSGILIGQDKIRLDHKKSYGDANFATYRFVHKPFTQWYFPLFIDVENKTIIIQMKTSIAPLHTNNPLIKLYSRIYESINKSISRMQIKIVNGEIETKMGTDELKIISDPPVLNVGIDMTTFPGVLHRLAGKAEYTDPVLGKRSALTFYEYITHMNMAAIRPFKKSPTASPLDKKRAAVFSGTIRDREDRSKLLDWVLEKTKFFEALNNKAKELKKQPHELKIVIKPDFMGCYNKNDTSSYTDPVLVEKLIDRITGQGFTDVTVGETHNLYNWFYTNREVEKVAEYAGYNGKGYKIVDLTEDAKILPAGPGTITANPREVSQTWAEADFRILFSKNKTDRYSYYGLHLKNVYIPDPGEHEEGPVMTGRQRAGLTGFYLKAFPVHFGFIDAIMSSDGQNGMYGSREPVETGTILGGENIIANDWVGASKMGLNPMTSPFMKQVVPLLGKPHSEYFAREITWKNNKQEEYETLKEYKEWNNSTAPGINRLFPYNSGSSVSETLYGYAFTPECDKNAFTPRKIKEIKPFKTLPFPLKIVIGRLRKALKPYRALLFYEDQKKGAKGTNNAVVEMLIKKISQYI